jgi:hypothetical protein
MSKLSDTVYKLLKQIFPHNVILSEHYVNFKGERLFFDYYIKDLGVLIECQGRQHDHYVEHFHGDAEGFKSSKKRDNLKIEYAEQESLTFISINEGERLDEMYLLDKIWSKIEP